MCLAILAIQMLNWKDVLSTVVTALGDHVAGILDFLQVLPEEMNEGRKINLSVRYRYRHPSNLILAYLYRSRCAVLLRAPGSLRESNVSVSV